MHKKVSLVNEKALQFNSGFTVRSVGPSVEKSTLRSAWCEKHFLFVVWEVLTLLQSIYVMVVSFPQFHGDPRPDPEECS